MRALGHGDERHAAFDVRLGCRASVSAHRAKLPEVASGIGPRGRVVDTVCVRPFGSRHGPGAGLAEGQVRRCARYITGQQIERQNDARSRTTSSRHFGRTHIPGIVVQRVRSVVLVRFLFLAVRFLLFAMRLLLLVVRAFILARRLLSFLATRLFQLIFLFAPKTQKSDERAMKKQKTACSNQYRLASVVHIRGLTLGTTQDLCKPKHSVNFA